MVSRAEQLRDMAVECRTLAATVRNDEVRVQLLEVAEHFQRLAVWHNKSAETHKTIHC
jgi:hypothetical protein